MDYWYRMDFLESALLIQEFIARKRAEAGEEEPVHTALLDLIELLESIRAEKKQAAALTPPQEYNGTNT